jgi:Peptidase MA superfamily
MPIIQSGIFKGFLMLGFDKGIKFLLLANFTLGACLYLMLNSPLPVYADKADLQKQQASKARFLLYFGDKPTHSNHGSKNNLINTLSVSALQTLNESYDELSRIFKSSPEKQVILRFLPARSFHEKTNSPEWTSAMYIGGEISIPIPENEVLNQDDLRRAIRHEYVHAVISELSHEKCPAWFDEGIAQLIEGEPNPILGPALRAWISNNNAISLTNLKAGFTLLNSTVVPAAYGQSLFAVRKLVNEFGMSAVKNYLTELGKGEAEHVAFLSAFKINQKDFETQLTADIKQWAKSDQIHP